MIILNDKKDCCGCHACVQRCPKQCILMREDEEGFLYPYIDTSLCINCGLCEQVCPVINQSDPRLPLKVYAAKNPNETIRQASSSGGLFTMLAEQILQRNGVVFGARFNEKWEVIHDYTETLEGLAAFRGSKYVQSRIGDNYQYAKTFLETGREVLFSGTPCQIAGLNSYLNKKYKNLLTVDLICHGVPSPKIWQIYLNETIKRTSKKKVCIENISFRDKRLGWKKFCVTLSLSTKDINGIKKDFFNSDIFSKNIFMKGFLSNLYLRPSCHSCPSRLFKSGSDITIGDFWGIEYIFDNFDDDKGVSAIMINSKKGETVYNTLKCKSLETDLLSVYKGNSPLKHSCPEHSQRKLFFNRFLKNNFYNITIQLCKPKLKYRIKYILRYILSKIGLLIILKKIIHRHYILS